MLRILVTLANAEYPVDQCLRSLAGQSVTDWRCYLLDDRPADQPAAVARRFCAADRRFHHLRNEERRSLCGSFHHAILGRRFADEDVCVAIDAADFLGDAHVFSRLLRAYEERPTWVTWGSCLYRTSEGFQVSYQEPTDRVPIRQAAWTPFHLRAWKVFLWKQIGEADLKDPAGRFWQASGDQAFMYPMIEMAGQAARFLGDRGYCVSLPANPLAVREQERTNDRTIRARPAYRALPMVHGEEEDFWPTGGLPALM